MVACTKEAIQKKRHLSFLLKRLVNIFSTRIYVNKLRRVVVRRQTLENYQSLLPKTLD